MALTKSDISSSISTDEGNTYTIGECLFIRTVTYHHCGRLVRISHIGPNYFLHLEGAAWVADDGRFMPCLADGTVNEVEPIPDGVHCEVAVNSIVDSFGWNHPLLRTQT